MMGRDETHDFACRWAFRKTFRRSPTPDELRDYKLALDERDRLGLNDALPIFSRLRNEAGLTVPAIRPERRRKVAIEPSASPAAPPPEPEPSQPEPSSGPASPPAGNGRPRAKERAEAFVREQLANGPAPGECVKAAAAQAKVSERFLIAAAERLGVRTQRGRWWLPN
jgi:hypothetical protein